jgi:hypothetical protein
MTRPQDAVDAFVDAVEHPSLPKADPDVATAFATGWQIGAARALIGTTREARAFGIGPADRFPVTWAQVRAGSFKLGARLKDAGEDPTEIDAALTTLREQRDAPSLDAAYTIILGQLYAADFRLGKALRVGRLVHALSVLEGADTVLGALELYAGELDALLSDLASALPANAAHSVKNSLRLWREAGAAAEHPAQMREQGVRWRALLSGETAAKDVLRLRDYVGTVESLMNRLHELARRGVRRYWWIGVVALALFLAGIALIIVDKSGTIVAGAGSILAAFGLTWKGLGGLLGRAAAHGEKALWSAQLDWSIAYRLTSLPAPTDIPADDAHTHLRELAAWQARKAVA